MGKRCSGKKRGIQRGVVKHKIGSKPVTGKVRECPVLGIQKAIYFSTAKTCFEFWFYSCSRLYLIPFTRTANGEYVPRDLHGKLIHLLVWFLKFLMLVQKLWGLGTMLLQQELKIETFMCANQALVYVFTFCISGVMVVSPKETMDLLNSWPLILSRLKQLEIDEPTEYDELSAAIKLIAWLAVTQGIALGTAMQSLIFSTLPSCYFPTAERLGLIPDGVLPRFAWQLIFFPLEYATFIPPMLSAPFTISMLFISIGVFRIYSHQLRNVRITSMELRAKIEQLYVCQELYGRVCYIWMKLMLPPTIFCMSFAIIFPAFISIRYTELPLVFYVFFPFCALACLLIIFWVAYDIVIITRDCEHIRGQLLRHESSHLRGMSKHERTRAMTRAKAMRVPEFPVGEFADFSLNVPVVVWDEVINQVLFLLSL